MNHRIRELAKLAKQYANDNEDPLGYCWEELFEVKFAELLIQGCITQIAMIGVSNYDDEAVMWTVERSIELIEEHYGIKQ